MTDLPIGLHSLASGLTGLNSIFGDTAISSEMRMAINSAVEALFGAHRHLIVYGSLGPGGSNHDQMEELAGEWREGWVTGILHEQGWGAHIGYPALQWDPAGSRVPAYLFTSDDLPAYWDRLDAFEGDEYRRVLVPFHDDEGVRAVGYLYELVRRS